MAAAGIVFEAVEPPSPSDCSWEWVPNPRYPFSPPADGKRQALLPPVSVDLSIQVIQGLAKAVVTQTFQNDSLDTIEKGIYQFPVPHESSVVDFTCKMATKTLQGQIKPRPVAREEFNQAVKRGYSAGLVEQDSPEIFRTELGHVPPHTMVEVKLSFIFFLKYRLSDEVTTTILTIPTYIAPRFGYPGFQVAETGPQRRTKLAVNIDVLASTDIRDVRSDTHRICVGRESRQERGQGWAGPSGTAASVRLDEDSACLDKDFVLIISALPCLNEETPQATFESHPDLEGSSTTMIEIPPSFMLRNQQPLEDTEVIFLADRSGSMHDKIHGLKSSLQFFLRGLPQTKFNLCCFGNHYTTLWDTSLPYNDETLTEALRYVDTFSSDMGGTNLLPALVNLIQSRGKGSLDVIVLTDGEVWNSDQTIEFVRRTHTASEGAVRFFAMGIGNAVSHELVEGIAKAGGGYAEIIPLASTQGWEERMVSVLRAVMTGHVSGISLEVEGVDLRPYGDEHSPPTLQMSPSNIVTLSPFIRNRIFVLAEDNQITPDSVIKIKTRSLTGHEHITRVPLHVLQEKDTTLHKFAARALISDLATRQSWIQRSPQILVSENDITRKEAERLGCQHSLVSKWTSFVAVEISKDTKQSAEEDYINISYDATVSGLEQLDIEDWEMVNSQDHGQNSSSASRFRSKRARQSAPDTFVKGSMIPVRPLMALQQSPNLVSCWSLPQAQIDANGPPSVIMEFSAARRVAPANPGTFNLDFSASEQPDILENFDFDTFLNTGTDVSGNGSDSNVASPPNAGRHSLPFMSMPPTAGAGAPVKQHMQSIMPRPPNPHESQMQSIRDRGSSRVNGPESQVDPFKDPVLFIHSILQHQKANGCFEIPPDKLEAWVGSDIHRAVSRVLEKLREPGPGPEAEAEAEAKKHNLAVTAVLVAFMKFEMSEQKSLWLRMVEKAEEWIEGQSAGWVEDGKESLMDIAEVEVLRVIMAR